MRTAYHTRDPASRVPRDSSNPEMRDGLIQAIVRIEEGKLVEEVVYGGERRFSFWSPSNRPCPMSRLHPRRARQRRVECQR